MTVTLEALKRARGQSLDFVMKQDYCIVQSMLQGHDLYEGIRAVIVDKDQHPKWDPASLDAITDDQVARYFDNTNKDILDL